MHNCCGTVFQQFFSFYFLLTFFNGFSEISFLSILSNKLTPIFFQAKQSCEKIAWNTFRRLLQRSKNVIIADMSYANKLRAIHICPHWNTVFKGSHLFFGKQLVNVISIWPILLTYLIILKSFWSFYLSAKGTTLGFVKEITIET